MSIEELADADVHVITAPIGRWLKRTDECGGRPVPIMAYGMESCVLLIWSDGTHTTRAPDAVFPASNWKVWEEIE